MPNRDLPIYEIEADLVAALRAGPRLVVSAPTGSGKSTQIPQMIADQILPPNRRVVVLQPRRLPTRMLAARVASERGARLGGEVGYQIRFQDVSSSETRIKYVTEGILLRQMLTNPSLPGVGAVIFDEFHERHLYGDLSLGRALALQATVRPDLLIVVMSATLDVEPLARFLDPCRVLSSAGRMYPVRIQYLERPVDFTRVPVWEAAAREFERMVLAGAEGDVLIFMPGAFEIGRTVRAIENLPAARGFVVRPLHGELPAASQDAALARTERRKVVVSTNVAETSLTIDGVRLVIDGGLARIPRFDAHRGINTLWIERISRASADQRAGRAGRTAPGECLRLWTEAEHAQRPERELPEVRRLDLAEALLTLKAGGLDDDEAFRWFEPPEPRALERAENLLRDLGAADPHTGRLTELGRRMVAFPAHPRYSRMLLAAGQLGCVREAALIAALTQGRQLLLRRPTSDAKDRRGELVDEEIESDFFLLMRAWEHADRSDYRVDECDRIGVHAMSARQVRPAYALFLRMAHAQGLPANSRPAPAESVAKCVLTGFADQLARRLDSGTFRCLLVHGRRGTLARDSTVRRSPLLVAAEIDEIEGKDAEKSVQLSLATGVRREWLEELFPANVERVQRAIFDSAAKRVVCDEQVLFRDLVVDSRRRDSPPAGAAAALLAEHVLKGTLTLQHWDHRVEQWILRLAFLAEHCPDQGLPPLTPDDRRTMVEQICMGATSYRDIKERQVWPTVSAWLSPAQQRLLDRHAPERLELANGRQARVTYAAGSPPFISLRIQELYGVTETPRIAMGRAGVVVHILAPNQRPVQVTQDLASFWREGYPRAKQELQRKYPKHEWR